MRMCLLLVYDARCWCCAEEGEQLGTNYSCAARVSGELVAVAEHEELAWVI